MPAPTRRPLQYTAEWGRNTPQSIEYCVVVYKAAGGCRRAAQCKEFRLQCRRRQRQVSRSGRPRLRPLGSVTIHAPSAPITLDLLSDFWLHRLSASYTRTLLCFFDSTLHDPQKLQTCTASNCTDSRRKQKKHTEPASLMQGILVILRHPSCCRVDPGSASAELGGN